MSSELQSRVSIYSNQKIGKWSGRGILTDSEDIILGLTLATKLLNPIKEFLSTVKSWVSPFLSLIESGAFSSFVKGVAKLIKEKVDSIVSSGGAFIFIHPWNSRNTVDVPFILADNPTKLRVDTSSGNHFENWAWKEPLKIPTLTGQNAILDIIKSFDDTSDSLRPRWNSSTYTGGILLLMVAEADKPLSILNTLSFLSTFMRDITDWSFMDKIKSEVENYSKANTEIQNDFKKLREGEISGLGKYKNTPQVIITTTDGTTTNTQVTPAIFDFTQYTDALKASLDSMYLGLTDSVNYASISPRWISITADLIPGVMQIKDSIDSIAEYAESMTVASENIIIAVINAIFDKIDIFIEFITNAMNMLEKLKSLGAGIGCYAFIIEPHSTLRGNDYLKSVLSSLSSFTGPAFVTASKKEHITNTAMEVLRNSNFATAIFAGFGKPDLSDVEDEMKKLGDLFGISWDKTYDEYEALIKAYEDDGFLPYPVNGTSWVFSDDKKTVNFTQVLSNSITDYTIQIYKDGVLVYEITGKCPPNTFSGSYTPLDPNSIYTFSVASKDASTGLSISESIKFDLDNRGGEFTYSHYSNKPDFKTVTPSDLSKEDALINTDPSEKFTIVTPDGFKTVTNKDIHSYLVTPNHIKLALNTDINGNDIPLIPLVIEQKSKVYQLYFGSDIGTGIMILLSDVWKTFVLPSIFELPIGTYQYRLLQNGVWGDILSFVLREKESLSDNCLFNYAPEERSNS